MFWTSAGNGLPLSRGWSAESQGGKHVRAFSRGQKRIAIFAAVGASCFGVQLALLTAMVHLGASRPIANAIGFAISAQVNFLLSSKVTWGDRSTSGWRDTGARWLGYNGTALVSLGVNTAVFTACYRAIGTTPAAAAGVLIGTVVVYLTCNLVIFRGARRVSVREAQAVLATDPDQVVAQ
jgi:putative flippase GtrA